MKIKILVFFICMLFFIPILSTTATTEPEPKLEIYVSPSEFGYTVFITNKGDTDAYNVTAEVTITGGILNRRIAYENFGVGCLSPNETHGIKGYAFGFGDFEVESVIGADNAETVENIQVGIIFLFFMSITY